MRIVLTFLLYLGIQSLFANTEKYRIIINDDPSTTITVAWNQISGNSAQVYYDTTDHGTDWTLYGNSKSADRIVNYRGMNNHFAKLTGLNADTIYYLVIRDNQGTSQRFWFRTAPNDLSRLSFIAGGDSRNNRTPRQNANKLVSKLKPHAVLFGGDMTNSDNDSQWRDWFDDWQLTTSADGRMIPIIPVRGNHENAVTVYNLFNTSNPDQYYSITFGNDLFTVFCLNSEISVTGNQLTWLTSELQTNTSIWKGAQYHKPMRPHTSGKSEGTHVYNAWSDLFYNNGVRLVVDCDSHTVKTTWPVRPSSEPGSDEGFIRDDSNGTVYIGEGCWGAPLRSNNDDKTWTRDSGSFNQFKLIFIDDIKIEARTINVNNADAVGEVANNDPFTLPLNLDVWNPTNGDVIEIFANSALPSPSTRFGDLSAGECFNTGDLITSIVEIDDPGSGITEIEFFVDGVSVSTDVTEPYTFSQVLPDGIHQISAVATDVNNRTDNITVQIYVGQFTDTVGISIASGDDDVEESEAGVLYTNSSDLEFVYDSYQSNGFQKIGLRFQNVTIPQGATINTAYIQFRSDETNSTAASLQIQMENAIDASEYVEALTNSLSTRNYLPSAVSWNPPAWTSTNQAGTDQRTPSLVGQVQNIVSNTDWSSGNAMAFMISGTGNSLTNTSAKRVADTFEGNYPAELRVNYSFICDDATLGLNANTFSDNIEIYPNPSSGLIHIEIPNTIRGSHVVDILDLKGKVIRTYKSNDESVIQLQPDLASGFYLLRISNSNNNLVAIKKLVVK